MPRLPFEPGLVSAPFELQGDPNYRWWVLHTKPRAEKALARRLLHLNRSVYLPLYPRRAMSRGRMVTSHLPLFPGYLFLYGTEEGRLEALKTNLVVKCLEVEDQPALDKDLRQIHQALTEGTGFAPEERLDPGDRVCIVQGPMRGLEGKVLRRGNQLRFLLEVRLLQQGVSVEVESWMISPL